MLFSERSIWTMVHGIGLGGAALLGLAAALFYLFDHIHPTLRDITLLHEDLNKARQRYRLTIGAPIDPDTLPSGSAEAIEVLKARTLELGGRNPQTVLTAPIYGRPRGLKPARLPV